MLDLLDDLRAEHEMAMILITHDMGVVAEAADEIARHVRRPDRRARLDARPLRHPEHPYTEALLGALPQLEGEGIRQSAPDGDPRPPAGSDRLRRPRAGSRRAAAMPGGDSCTEQMPELREVRKGHWVRSAHPASERAVRAAGGDARVSTDGVLLEVEDLDKHFPIKRRALIERKVGDVKAVDGVSFEIKAGRDARPRRRVRLGQVDHRLLRPAADQADLRLGASSRASS